MRRILLAAVLVAVAAPGIRRDCHVDRRGPPGGVGSRLISSTTVERDRGGDRDGDPTPRVRRRRGKRHAVWPPEGRELRCGIVGDYAVVRGVPLSRRGC